jgi:hypothetical protein
MKRVNSLRRIKGQAILWFLATAITCCAAMIGVYNVGQLTSEKQKVVNASDAGAHAGALVEARTLNFMAYSNRLMVTTEVLVAQTASMDSWLRYIEQTSGNISKVSKIASLIPVVGAAFAAISSVMEAVKDVVHVGVEALDAAVPVVITFENVMRTAYSGAMIAAQLNGAIGAEMAAKQAVDLNKTTFNNRTDKAGAIPPAARAFTFAKNVIAWESFTDKYTGQDRKYAREVILKSRDAFTNDPCNGPNPNCRGGLLWNNFSILGVAGIEKNGGTKLVGFDRWEAQDTLEFWTGVGKLKTYVPIGWGRATVSNNGERGDIWPGGKGKAANSLAYSSTKTFNNWKGIPELYDVSFKPSDTKPLSNKDKEASKNLGLDFLVVVVKPKTSFLLAETHKIGVAPNNNNTGSLDSTATLAADQLMSVSKARVYFERPVRNTRDWTATKLFRDDTNKEYGSLYNPYWQVRLNEPTVAEKELALGLSGAPSFGSVVTQ